MICQYFTPVWVAQALVERHFAALDSTDGVIEPSCGPGAFLRAIPAHVPAVGVEMDPVQAARARAATGRPVIEGDFRTVPIDFQPTAIIGNPPFRGALIDAFLGRCHELLPEGGRVGLILPAYAFRTASRVVDLTERWSVAQEMLPRSAFSYRMREPLMFALFSKDRRRVMVGFALFAEERDRQCLGKPYRDLLSKATGSAWRAVCRLALERLGGAADLPAIYAELERNRPSRTEWWREKIRQTLRVYPGDFVAVAAGQYRLAEAA
jgi:hypothetical protein